MHKLHVLILPSWYPENARDIRGSFFREQAIAIAKYDVKVGVLYPELRSLKNWQSIISGQRGIDVECDDGVVTYRSKGMNWFPRTVSPALKLFIWHGLRLYHKYISENGVPDLIHVHSLLNAGVLAAVIFDKYAVPYLVTEHSSAYAAKLISPKSLHIAQNVTSMASRKFAVSKPLVDLLNKIFKSENSCWEEMPNIVNESFCTYEITPQYNEVIEFINVARMDENKCQANILHAFSGVCKINPNIRLTLVGDGHLKKKLQQLASNLGIIEKVRFAGSLSRNEVLRVVAAADIFVLSSRYETFGVVIIEALALGKPVIATRCGGPESILRKQDGILVPIDNPEALIEAMLNMIENHDRYNPHEIRKACIERFGEESIAKRLIEIYKDISLFKVRKK